MLFFIPTPNLTLCIFYPPFLFTFTSHDSLAYSESAFPQTCQASSFLGTFASTLCPEPLSTFRFAQGSPSQWSPLWPPIWNCNPSDLGFISALFFKFSLTISSPGILYNFTLIADCLSHREWNLHKGHDFCRFAHCCISCTQSVCLTHKHSLNEWIDSLLYVLLVIVHKYSSSILIYNPQISTYYYYCFTQL